MHSTESNIAALRPWRSAAIAAASAAWLLLPPAAAGQTRPGDQHGPQGGPALSSPSPSSAVFDKQLDATAKAIQQIAAVKQTYTQKIAAAPPSEKEGVLREANAALVKAVTDQGLSVDEYNAILQRAQADAALRQRLVERIKPAAQ
jgi:Spy/CpxP family protein refolding chaperone